MIYRGRGKSRENIATVGTVSIIRLSANLCIDIGRITTWGDKSVKAAVNIDQYNISMHPQRNVHNPNFSNIDQALHGSLIEINSSCIDYLSVALGSRSLSNTTNNL